MKVRKWQETAYNPQWSLAFANKGYKQILMCSQWIFFATYGGYGCYGG